MWTYRTDFVDVRLSRCDVTVLCILEILGGTMLDFLLTFLSQRFVADDLGNSFPVSDRVWDDLGRNCSWTGE